MQYYYFAMLFVSIVGPIINYCLKIFSVGLVTYVGINLTLDAAKDYMINNLTQIPLQVQQILGLAKFDIAINIYLAAVTTRLVLAGIDKLASGGTKKKWTTMSA